MPPRRRKATGWSSMDSAAARKRRARAKGAVAVPRNSSAPRFDVIVDGISMERVRGRRTVAVHPLGPAFVTRASLMELEASWIRSPLKARRSSTPEPAASVRRVHLTQYANTAPAEPVVANALVTTRAIAAGDEIFAEALELLGSKGEMSSYEQQLGAQFPEPLIELPGGCQAAGLIRRCLETRPPPAGSVEAVAASTVPGVADRRSNIYMMNHARGRAATVITPFKRKVGEEGEVCYA